MTIYLRRKTLVGGIEDTTAWDTCMHFGSLYQRPSTMTKGAEVACGEDWKEVAVHVRSCSSDAFWLRP